MYFKASRLVLLAGSGDSDFCAIEREPERSVRGRVWWCDRAGMCDQRGVGREKNSAGDILPVSQTEK